MIEAHPPRDPEAREQWYTALAHAWAYFAEGTGGLGAVYYPDPADAPVTEETIPTRRGRVPVDGSQADRAMVDYVDAKLLVSRLVDRARYYAGEQAFRAWMLRRTGWLATYEEIARYLNIDPRTARAYVGRFDSSILDMHNGDTVDAYLCEGEKWAWIPDTDHQYIVTTLGAVFSLKRGRPDELHFPPGGRVLLHPKRGVRYRPHIGALLERVFGPRVRLEYEANLEQE